MPVLKIPTPLRPYVEGQSVITLKGNTVNEVLHEAVDKYPELSKHLYGEGNQLRPYVNLFLDKDNIKELNGLDTPLQENDTLLIIPSIAGGS